MIPPVKTMPLVLLARIRLIMQKATCIKRMASRLFTKARGYNAKHPKYRTKLKLQEISKSNNQ